MKEFVWIAVCASVLVGCASKKVVTTDTNLLEEICQTELKRHGDIELESNFKYFGSPAMDAYSKAPGDPTVLMGYFEKAEGVCRGAYLQLLLDSHGEFVHKKWKKFDDLLSNEERTYLTHMIRQRKLAQYNDLAFNYLKSDYLPLREAAFSLVEVLDQHKHLKKLQRAAEAEQNEKALIQLVYALNIKDYPETQALLEMLMKRDITELKRTILTVWATSDVPHNKELIEPYTRDANKEIAAVASTLMDKLQNKTHLQFTLQNAPNVIKTEKAPASPELQQELIKAIHTENIPAIDSALEKGADLNQIDRYLSPFQKALPYSDYATIKHLIEKGADLSKNPSGENLFLYLARNAFKDAQPKLKRLHEHGFDLNVTTESGESGIMLATMNNRIDAVKALLELGADPNMRDNLGRRPVDIARLLEYDNIIAVLEAAEKTAQ